MLKNQEAENQIREKLINEFNELGCLGEEVVKALEYRLETYDETLLDIEAFRLEPGIPNFWTKECIHHVYPDKRYGEPENKARVYTSNRNPVPPATKIEVNSQHLIKIIHSEIEVLLSRSERNANSFSEAENAPNFLHLKSFEVDFKFLRLEDLQIGSSVFVEHGSAWPMEYVIEELHSIDPETTDMIKSNMPIYMGILSNTKTTLQFASRKRIFFS